MSKERNLIAAALAVLFLVAVPSAQANFVVNGGMELDVDANGPDDWHNFDSPPSDNTVLVQSTDVEPGNGTYSAHLQTGPAGGPQWLWQDLTTLEPETDYVFDCWFKGAAVDVHFEASTNWHGDHIGGGDIFWAPYTAFIRGEQPLNPDGPSGDWWHATTYSQSTGNPYPNNYEFGPDPWIITTGVGQTFLRIQFINSWENGNMWIDEVRLELLADVNGDNFVGAIDWNRILANWGMTGAGRRDGDVDGDGTVGGGDYSIVMSNWGKGILPGPPEAPGVIPEPGTLLILAGGLLASLFRRR